MRLSATILVQNIITAASAIEVSGEGDPERGPVRSEAIQAVLKQCDACLAALASAAAAGIDSTTTVAIARRGAADFHTMTLTRLHAWCLEQALIANESLYRVRIQQAILQAGVWVGDLDEAEELSEDHATLAAETGRCLQHVLRDAQNAGVSDRMLFRWNSTTITLAAATKLADYVAIMASRRIRFLQAERREP